LGAREQRKRAKFFASKSLAGAGGTAAATRECPQLAGSMIRQGSKVESMARQSSGMSRQGSERIPGTLSRQASERNPAGGVSRQSSYQGTSPMARQSSIRSTGGGVSRQSSFQGPVLMTRQSSAKNAQTGPGGVMARQSSLKQSAGIMSRSNSTKQLLTPVLTNGSSARKTGIPTSAAAAGALKKRKRSCKYKVACLCLALVVVSAIAATVWGVKYWLEDPEALEEAVTKGLDRIASTATSAVESSWQRVTAAATSVSAACTPYISKVSSAVTSAATSTWEACQPHISKISAAATSQPYISVPACTLAAIVLGLLSRPAVASRLRKGGSFLLALSVGFVVAAVAIGSSCWLPQQCKVIKQGLDQIATAATSQAYYYSLPACIVAAIVLAYASRPAFVAPGGRKARPARSVSQRVNVLIKRLGSTDMDARMKDIENEERGYAATGKEVQAKLAKQESLKKLSVASEGKDLLRIQGLYLHQVLKCGLRHLDETWPADGLLESVDMTPAGRPRQDTNFAGRFKLIMDLLQGSVRLQSVPAADLQAAQYGIKSLTLRQLLRLRVSHLDYVPSGRGSDVVFGQLTSGHEAFLESLDRSLFTKLGEKATYSLSAADPWRQDTSQWHSIGRDVVLMAAASKSIPKPSSWCWYRGNVRKYFDTKNFQCSDTFPASGRSAGVLEVSDLSKRDAQEPTGQLLWFDWRIKTVYSESALGKQTRGLQKQLSLTPSLLSGARATLRKTQQ